MISNVTINNYYKNEINADKIFSLTWFILNETDNKEKNFLHRIKNLHRRQIQDIGHLQEYMKNFYTNNEEKMNNMVMMDMDVLRIHRFKELYNILLEVNNRATFDYFMTVFSWF